MIFIRLIALLLVLLQPAIALGQDLLADPDAFDARLAEEGGSLLPIIGRVAVLDQEIVDLGVENATMEATSRAIALAAQLGSIADRLGTTEFVGLAVDRAQFEALLASGLFAEIRVDDSVPPTLGSSGPVIGSGKVHDLAARGAGTAIVIIDSGVDATHPMLAGRVVEEACFSGSSGTAACLNGSDAPGAGAPCPPDVYPCGHGTHVAGIAAGNGALVGLAPDASIIAIQAGSIFPASDEDCPDVRCVRFADRDLIAALSYVAGPLSFLQPVTSVNMSLGGGKYGECPADYLAGDINTLVARQIAVTISSGNEQYSDGVGSPGCVPAATTVGGTDDRDRAYVDSNSHPVVDLLAPGVAIESSVPGGGTETWDGTSMAAPMVAGAFAIFDGYFAQGAPAIEAVLKQTGTPAPTLAEQADGKPLMRPRINLEAAFAELVRLTPAGADVWMRDTWSDNGKEPDPATNGQAMSSSPSVWIRHQRDCGTALYQHQNPHTGFGNVACVALENRGFIQGSGTLEIYITDATLDAAASWTRLTSEHYDAVPSHTRTIVDLPLPSLDGAGHHCLLVRWVSDDELVDGQLPELELPGGIVQAVKNDNDLVWRNVDIVELGNPASQNAAIRYETDPGGTVNLVVKVNALNPAQYEDLGVMLVAAGYDPDIIRSEPTSRYYQMEGPYLILPLKPGVYYIPDVRIPEGLDETGKRPPLVDIQFRGLPAESSGRPRMMVEFSTVADIAAHKTGASRPIEPAVTYVIQ